MFEEDCYRTLHLKSTVEKHVMFEEGLGGSRLGDSLTTNNVSGCRMSGGRYGGDGGGGGGRGGQGVGGTYHPTLPVLKHGGLQKIHSSEERQRVGQQGLGDQDEVDDDLEAGVRQVVGDHLLGGHAPRQEPDVGEDGLEDGRRHVGPAHHAGELAAVHQVAFQRGQEDLRGVAEHDDAQGDGQRPDVDAEPDLAPVPVAGLRQAVDDDDEVDEHVGHGAPEAEPGDAAEGGEEGAGEQRDRADHDPRRQVHGRVREAALDEVPAQQYVQDAGHQQLDDLGQVHQAAPVAAPPHVLRDLHVAAADSDESPHGVRFVQAVDEDVARVAADVGHQHHGDDGPVAALHHGVRKTDDEHSLQTESHTGGMRSV